MAWPEVRFIMHGDSSFCREDRCKMKQVDYLLVLAKKGRLTAEISMDLAQDAEQYNGSNQAPRTFKEISHKSREDLLRVRKRTSLPSARGGGDTVPIRCCCCASYFNPRPRAGGDPS